MIVVACVEGIKVDNIERVETTALAHLPEDEGNRGMVADAPWSCVLYSRINSERVVLQFADRLWLLVARVVVIL